MGQIQDFHIPDRDGKKHIRIEQILHVFPKVTGLGSIAGLKADKPLQMTWVALKGFLCDRGSEAREPRRNLAT